MPNKEKIKEVSKIEVKVGNKTIKKGFHDIGDATERAIDEISKGAKEVIIKQEIKLTPKKEKK